MLKISDNEIEYYLDKLICGLFIVDIETRKIIYVNEVALKLLECEKNDVIGKLCHGFLCSYKIDECPVLDKSKELKYQEDMLIKSNQSTIDIIKTVSEISINDKRYLLESFVDNTHQKKLAKQTQILGMTDPLTGSEKYIFKSC